MLHRTTWYKLIAMVLVLLITLPLETAHAARRFSFNANLAEITHVCRDGIAFYFANDGRNSDHNGEGNLVVFTVSDFNGVTLGTQTLMLSFHADAPPNWYSVYALGQILWNDLPATTEVWVDITFYDVGENSVKPFSDSFIVTNCSLKQVLPSQFTYQGQLLDGNNMANGQYDFRLRLYDTETGESQIADDYVASAVGVSNGQFTLMPAFGITAFNGAPRWLDIAVKPFNAPITSYASLTPRQQIVAVPYALQSLTVPAHHHLGENWLGNWPLIIQGSFHSPNFTLMSPYANETALSNYGFVVDNIHPTGSGLLSAAVGQVALYGYNRSVSTSNGIGVFGFSENGQGGVFATRSGSDILAGYQLDQNNNWQKRFWVDQFGRIYASDFIYTVGAYRTDSTTYAEMLPAQAGVEVGDVLVIGSDGQLLRSTSPNTTGVVGVYSASAGYVGGYTIPQELIASALPGEGDAIITDTNNEDEKSLSVMLEEKQLLLAEKEAIANAGKIPVAIMGMTPVKVSTENGAIIPGDLLTTSTLPGHAMKATPVDIGGIAIHRPGTIIGKALEGLAEGTGVIRVLITLQ